MPSFVKGVRLPQLFDQRPGVMVKWSTIFDHDHDQNFIIAVVKWSELVILTKTMSKIKDLLWSNGQNLSNLPIDHEQNRRCHFFFFKRDWVWKDPLEDSN